MLINSRPHFKSLIFHQQRERRSVTSHTPCKWVHFTQFRLFLHSLLTTSYITISHYSFIALLVNPRCTSHFIEWNRQRNEGRDSSSPTPLPPTEAWNNAAHAKLACSLTATTSFKATEWFLSITSAYAWLCCLNGMARDLLVYLVYEHGGGSLGLILALLWRKFLNRSSKLSMMSVFISPSQFLCLYTYASLLLVLLPHSIRRKLWHLEGICGGGWKRRMYDWKDRLIDSVMYAGCWQMNRKRRVV